MEASECECQTWARDNAAAIFIASHHPNCDLYTPEIDARALLLRLIDGIESWAADEDGIHSDCWAAYVAACGAVGQYGRPVSREPV